MSDSNGVLPVLALGIDSDQLDKDAKKAEERLRALAKAAETAENQWDDFVAACEKAAEATQKYSHASVVAQRATAGTAEATKEAARQAQINALHIDTFRKTVSELGISQEEVAQAMVRFQGASRPMQQAVSGTAAEVKKLGDQADDAARKVQRFNSGMQSVGTPTGSFVRDVENASGGLGRFGQGLVRATDDIGVFVRQVSSGQDAMTAFTVQLAQAAMAFGAGGFFVSMAASAALLATQLLGSAGAQEKLEKAIKGSEESFSRATRAAADWRRGLEEEARTIQGLTVYYQNLDAARQAYERRALERSRRELQTEALNSTNDAIGPIRGFEGVLGNIQQAAAARAARGQAFGELPEQVRQAEALMRAFRELQQVDPARALVNLADGAARLARETGPLSADLARLVENIDKGVPAADRLSRQLALNAVQLQAVGGGSQGAAQGVTQVGTAAGGATAQVNSFAAGLGRALEALARLRDRSMVENPFASVNAEITRLSQQLDALDQGGLAAYRRVLTEQERQSAVTQRATTLQAEFTRSLIETGASAEQAQQAAEELAPSFVQSAVTAVDAAQRITRRVQALEDAAKSAGRAVRSMPDARQTVYEEPGLAGQTVFPVDVVNIIDRNNQRRLDAEQRANDQWLQGIRRTAEEAVRVTERATDDVVRYVADEWADVFRENARGFEGMLDSFEATAKRAFARITAEALIRPVVAPIMNGLNLGALLGGDSSGMPGPGATGGFGGLGSLSDLLGIGSGLNSLIGGNLTGGFSVSSLLSTPVLGGTPQFLGDLGVFADAGALNAPLGTTLGGLSLGPLLGAAGIGALGGGMLARFTGGNQVGGSIGGGLGAGAGMALAPLLGLTGPVGAIAGGLIGAFGGGLLGPGNSFSGGDALVGVGAGGQLEMRGYAGKNFDDAGQLMQQTAQQVAALNQQLQALGLHFDKALASREWVGAVGGGESPNPTNLTDALSARGVFGSLQSDDRRVNHSLAMAAQRGTGFEGMLEVAQKANMVAAAIDNLTAPVGAFEAQINATRKQFEELIGVARSVDLHGEAEALTARLSQTIDDLLRQRWEGLDAASIDRQRRVLATQEGNTEGGALALFDRQSAQTMRQLEDALRELGIWGSDFERIVAEERGALAAERAALQREFELRRQAASRGLQDRIFAAQNDPSTQAGALAAFERAAAQEREDAVRDGLVNLVELEQTHAAERAAIIAEFARQTEERLRQMGGSLRAFIDGVRTGQVGNYGSPSDQFAAAQDVFSRDLTLARTNDEDALGRITGSAETVLATARQMFGSSLQFQTIKQMVLSSLESLPATKSYDQLILEELRKMGGQIEVSVIASLAHSLRLAVEGNTDLTVDQRAILMATTAQVEHVLRLKVEGSAGLTADQKALLDVEGESVLRQLLLSVDGVRALTAGQREILSVSAASMARVLEIIVTGDGAFTNGEREIVLTEAATLQRILRLAVTGTPELSDAQREIIETADANITRTLALLVSGVAGLTDAQEEILAVSAASVTRSLALLVSGATALSPDQREILTVAGASITRTLQLIVSGESGLTDAQREIAAATTAVATRTLSLLVTGAAMLTTEQREIASYTTATAIRTLQLVVSGQAAGLTSQQKEIALATSGEALRTLELLVKGSAGLTTQQREIAMLVSQVAVRSLELLVTGNQGLTAAQREIAFAGAASFTRALNLIVSDTGMSPAQRSLLLETTAPFQRALELAIGLTGANESLRTALLDDLGTVSRTLALAAAGGSMTDDQRAILLAEQESITRTLNLLTQDPGITPDQRALLNVVSGEVRALTIRQAIETTETVEISRSIDDKLSSLLGKIEYAIKEQLAYLHNLGDVRMFLFHIRELSRGAEGGIRVTTLQASGAPNGGFARTNSKDPNQIVWLDSPFGHRNWGGLESGGWVREYLAAGGWVGNGTWNRDSVVASFAGGGDIALAGGEHVTNAPMAARYAPELNAINAGVFHRGESPALVNEVSRLRGDVARLESTLARLMARTATAGERAADAAETTAVETKRMARRSPPVGARGVA